jgi:hypothetical protein
LSHICAWG